MNYQLRHINLFLVFILGVLCCSNCTDANRQYKVTTMPNTSMDQAELLGDTLRMLVWENYAPDKYVKEFEKEIFEKYGRKIVVEVSNVQSPDDFYVGTLMQHADIITPTHHVIKDERFQYIKKKLIIPPNLSNIPNYKYIIPSIREAGYSIEDSVVYGIPLANGPYGLAYNKNLVPDAPQSWNFLWDPRCAKKYSIGKEEYINNIAITALSLGYGINSINSFDSLNNEVFKARLGLLVKNAARMWEGVDNADDLSGLCFATSFGDSFVELQERGEKWGMANPVEGTIWWLDYSVLTWSLNKRPFMKKVAEEWINKCLGKQYQLENLLRNMNNYPVVMNISSFMTRDEKLKIQPEKYGFYLKDKTLHNINTRRDRNGMKLLWEEALKRINKDAE